MRLLAFSVSLLFLLASTTFPQQGTVADKREWQTYKDAQQQKIDSIRNNPARSEALKKELDKQSAALIKEAAKSALGRITSSSNPFNLTKDTIEVLDKVKDLKELVDVSNQHDAALRDELTKADEIAKQLAELEANVRNAQVVIDFLNAREADAKASGAAASAQKSRVEAAAREQTSSGSGSDGGHAGSNIGSGNRPGSGGAGSAGSQGGQPSNGGGQTSGGGGNPPAGGGNPPAGGDRPGGGNPSGGTSGGGDGPPIIIH